MEQLSFLDKLGILWENIIAHPVFILLLLSPVLIFALNKKINKKFIIAIYMAIILIVLFVGNATIFALLDNVIDGLFMVLYFPNFVTLFIVVVASAVIALITFLKKHILKVNKIINITGFAIVQTIFCLILTTVQVNKIDIYKENALYANDDVLTLMQLLMGTFALQVLAVLIFTIIEKITDKLDAKDEEVKKYRNIERAKQLTKVEPEELLFTPNEKTETAIPQKEEVPILEIKEETLTPLEPLEPEDPLDKTLIGKEKIKPINLVDAINEEQVKAAKQKIEETPDIFKATPQFITKPKQEKELITGLVIINLPKTIKAIHNIKRVYTM